MYLLLHLSNLNIVLRLYQCQIKIQNYNSIVLIEIVYNEVSDKSDALYAQYIPQHSNDKLSPNNIWNNCVRSRRTTNTITM